MHIIRVSDSQTEKEFIRFPARIYNHSPHWVRPLDQEIRELFDKSKNPFFENGEAERWILTNFRGRMIGRIAAFADYRTSGKYSCPAGGIGFFECIDHQKAAFTLFDQCRDWLAQKGMQAMNGPVNMLSLTSKWGLLTHGFSEEPVYGMPYHHEYYQSFFENYGFRLHHKLYNYTSDFREDFLSQEFKDEGNSILSDSDYHIAVANKQHPKTFARDLREVYNDAWQDQPGYLPMSSVWAHDLVQRLIQVMDEKIIYFVYHQHKPVAFFINLPEMNRLYKHMDGRVNPLGKLKYLFKGEKDKKVIALMMGIKKTYQGKGIDAALAMTLEKHIKSANAKYKSVEITGVSDSDPKVLHIAHSLQMKVSKVFHTYHFNFHQDLPNQQDEIFSKQKFLVTPPYSVDSQS